MIPNVKDRIGLVFATALGTLAVVLVALFAADRLAHWENNQIKLVHLPSVESTERLDAIAQRIFSAELILLVDATNRTSQMAEIEQLKREFLTELAEEEALAETQAEQAIVADIRKEAELAFAQDDRLQGLVRAGKIAEAHRVHKFLISQSYGALREDTRELYQLNLDQIATMRDRSFQRSDAIGLASLAFAILGAAVAAYFWRKASREIVGPLSSLQRTAQALEAGRFVEDTDPYAAHTAELATLQHAFNRMSNQLEESAHQLQEANASLEHQVAERTRELREANTELKHVVSELQTLDQLKSQFIAITSHELLTPINFITGFGSALEDELLGPLNDKQHDVLAKMMGGAERLTRMVRNTLEYSQIQAGELTYLPAAFDYTEVIREAEADVAAAFARKRQTLAVDAPSAPLTLWADPDRTRQILVELLDNASKFSPEGVTVSVKVTFDDDVATTEVTDPGRGIPQEALPNLFTPFYQEDTSSTREQGGMGLGLPIAYHLTAKMGGAMLVDSCVGEGTTIRFTLPRQPKTPLHTESAANQRPA